MKNNEDIKEAVRVLKKGGIVIFPTDTAYGIGCKVNDEKAVQRLFSLRKRAETKAVPVLVDSLEMAQKYVTDIPSAVIDNLIITYWPGALTIVLQSNIHAVPALVRGGGNTIGLRMPNHLTTLEIIKGVGAGIVGCSANFAGEATPYSFKELDPELVKLADYVVPGKCPVKQASTVIDCSVEPWKVLREGAISLSS